MAAHADNQAVAFSEKVFERLLAAYPKAHREEYGAAMAQLFRDQCRDAWSESRGWGLAKLWLRVLPDVIGTSLLEHLEAVKERKFMLNRIAALFRSVQSFKFLTVFTAVFLLVITTTTVVTFIMPDTYVGKARISVEKVEGSANIDIKNTQNKTEDFDPYFIQTQLEMMQSQVVLGRVVENLNLNEKWGAKFHDGKRLATPESIALLKRHIEMRPIRGVAYFKTGTNFHAGERLTTPEAIDLLKRSNAIRPIHNTSLIEIRAYSDKPEEAADLANATAEASREFRKQTMPNAPVMILDKQLSPNFRPVRPNKYLNITLGVLVGIVLGLVAGAGVAGISFLSRRNAPPKIAS
jgi:capsular polysaccharide biosynthesis protein